MEANEKFLESVRSFVKSVSGLLLFCVLSGALTACDNFGPGDLPGRGYGVMRISFAPYTYPKAGQLDELPDTNEFIITIKSSGGEELYNGKFGDCPEKFELKSGSYDIKIVSSDFKAPSFDSPCFGDEQCVVVKDNQCTYVQLVCTQINSGMRLQVDESFLSYCPNGVLYLKSTEGKLMYGYSEKRMAYFNPGAVSVILSDSGVDQVLLTKLLQPSDMLKIKVSANGNYSSSSSPSSQIAVDVDTSRNWVVDKLVIGGPVTGGETKDEALTVAQARKGAGLKDVWVCGYIVGGDLSSSSASFVPPFDSRTNLLLGPKSSTVDKSECLSVQLPSGDVRDALNLADNAHLLGKKILLQGDLYEAYFGIPGLKNVSDYEVK